jgi:methanogenic corrinoid protein MtbC1
VEDAVIVWCVACQRYVGDKPPLEDFRISHGLCPRCEAHADELDEAAVGAMEPIRRYHDRLRACALGRTDESLGALLDEGSKLGIPPRDLLVGLLQPTLYEVGVAWARDEIGHAQEHAVTARVSALLEQIWRHFPACAALRDPRRATIALGLAPGNAHVIGLAMLQLALALAGIASVALPDGLAPEALVTEAHARGASVLGLSIALPSQLPMVLRVGEVAREALGPKLRVWLGGYPIRCGLRPPPESGVEAVDGVDEIVRRLTVPRAV